MRKGSCRLYPFQGYQQIAEAKPLWWISIKEEKILTLQFHIDFLFILTTNLRYFFHFPILFNFLNFLHPPKFSYFFCKYISIIILNFSEFIFKLLFSRLILFHEFSFIFPESYFLYVIFLSHLFNFSWFLLCYTTIELPPPSSQFIRSNLIQFLLPLIWFPAPFPIEYKGLFKDTRPSCQLWIADWAGSEAVASEIMSLMRFEDSF